MLRDIFLKRKFFSTNTAEEFAGRYTKAFIGILPHLISR